MLALLRPLALSAAATLRSRAPAAVRPSFASWFPQQTVLPFSSSAAAWIVRKPTQSKLKTHKGAAKRFKALANGMFKRAKAGRVHLNSNRSMSSTRLNRLGKTAYARPAERRTLRKLLPYA
ncbi:hypothetical protein JCM8115_000584 [Rhodotorula mucilaginosa]|uniref:50S ribosomal protein L35 n=1 Tax=Rhodotorula mucilaginosa TaxID=5537 RepID=A0A9P7B927_RHOMI|nr:hypothetical protein C6P46_003604 [Rhodotorula mucilaginosa]TKA54508.1 hypothetical protein B0A53_03201 [Rhodotorula sp. CCFEE 5036]